MLRWIAGAAIAFGIAASGSAHAQNYSYNSNSHNTIIGGQPGSGPYDSAIAQMGIAAGASILNNIITSQRPQPYYGAPYAGPEYPPIPPNTVYYQPRRCQQRIVGYDEFRNPIIGRSCY